VQAVTGDRAVVITGVGALCALGDRTEEIFAALCDGRVPFAPPTLAPAAAVPGHLAAEVRGFAPEKYLRPGNVRPLDRIGRLALVGVELALADSGWTLDAREAHDVGLVLGTMFCGMHTIGEFDRRALQAGPEYASPMDFSNTVLNAAAGQVAIWQRLRGINSTIAGGAASGVLALGYAAGLIRTGRADVLVAGGAEELSLESLVGFSRAGRLAVAVDGAPGRAVPFDADSTGGVLGEGAAFLVLEAEASALARGARVIGRVLGSATTFDPAAGTKGPADGATLARAIARALHNGGVAAGTIGAVAASAAGSPRLDRAEAQAIETSVGRDVPVMAIKAMTGETLGAAGALQAIAALESMRGGRLPGIAGFVRPQPEVHLDLASATRPLDASRALVTAVAPEGNCAALVIATT
jgi:3-oxoacyl-[acyl-carrier-protein] synthase II